MRRILLLITDLKIGGTPTVVRELATRINRWPDVHVHVACLSEWGPVADQIRAAGVDVTALGARSMRDIGTIRQLSRLIRQQQIDTVFSFLVHANAAAAISSWTNRRVRYFQAIQTTQPRPRWHWWVQGLIAGAARRIVVPSESVARAAQTRAGIDRQKIVIIPNAVDVHEFEGLSPGAHARATRPPPFPIGFIGRLDPIKRVGDLLQAIAPLRNQLHLHVFGDGADRRKIEALIAQLYLRDAVTMHGQVPRPQDALSQIRLLVLPSEAEGFPMVLIEAMAAGVPIVATGAPGIRDVLTHERTGLLVPVGDARALSEAIRHAVEDEPLRRALAQSAHDDVQQKYSWEKVIEQYRQLLIPPASIR